MQPSRLLSPADVAEQLGVSVQTLAVWRWGKRYDLPYIKVGACVRYRLTDVEQFIQARRQTVRVDERRKTL